MSTSIETNAVNSAGAVADGTIVMRDKLTGTALATITPADHAAIEKWLVDSERAEAEHQSYWGKALEAARSACSSPALLNDIRENDRLDELADWLMILGDTDGLKLFRETVIESGTLDGCRDPEKIIFDAWNDHHASPGDWRGLILHVRALDAGGGGPPNPGASMTVGAVPEASHLATDQMNAARLAAHFGGKEIISAAGDFYVWKKTHWARDPGAATQIGAQLSRIVGEEAKGSRETFEALAAQNPDGKKLEATVRRDKSKLQDTLLETAQGRDMVRALEKAEALEKWAKQCEMRTNITNALGLLRDLLTVDANCFDRDPALFNCLNGTIDLRTGMIKPHDPKDLITHCAPVNYKPNAKSPRFKKFLEEILGPEPAKFMQSWSGYCLTGEVREQKVAVHIGEGGNGKTTLAEAIDNVMGSYAHTAPRGLLTAANGDDRHPTEIADLFRKRLVTASESEDNATLRESFVKQATGGDPLSGRHMGKDFFTFLPTHKLQLMTNHKPNIRGSDYGIWRRILLLNYHVRFGTAEEIAAGRATRLRDTTLRDALLAEREGIFAWLVQGAVGWYRDGLRPPSSVLEESEAYRMEQDRVGQFVHECCVLEDTWSPFSGAFVGLYSAYGSWCRESGYQALGMKKFIDELARVVPRFRKAERKLNFDGVRKTVNGAYGVKVNIAGPNDSVANGDLI
jgi:putative DNA primase/helicase